MNLFDMVIIGISLAMDASAVAAVNGMSITSMKIKTTFLIAIFFGFFQGFMPLVGYFVGSAFSEVFATVAHFVAFVLLTIVGINMIRESRKQDKSENCKEFNFRILIVQSIATSLDALAIGVSLAIVQANIFTAATVIGIITAILSFIAVYIGKFFGDYLCDKAEFAGGVVLILIGIKIILF